MNTIEVCYSPALFEFYQNNDAIVVVVDIFRATSSICTAFAKGVKSIIPVKSQAEAKEYKAKGFIVAAERDGLILDFADLGNSPYNFSEENVGGKDVVYSTTNGTKTIQTAHNSKAAVVGAFSNITVLSKWLEAQNTPVIILCAGWKNKYNIEDSVFAGALAELLLSTGKYSTICDATHAALDMWKNNKSNMWNLVEKCGQRERLRKNNLDDCIDYCLEFDTCNVVPMYDGYKLFDVLK